jgi:hypothetical protein
MLHLFVNTIILVHRKVQELRQELRRAKRMVRRANTVDTRSGGTHAGDPNETTATRMLPVNLLDLPPPAWPQGGTSQLQGLLLINKHRAENDGGHELIVLTQARVRLPERAARLIYEVVLTAAGAGGAAQAVLTENRAWQRLNTAEFHYRSRERRAEVEDYESTQWRAVMQVPLAELKFATPGAQVLNARITLRSGETGRTITSGQASCPITDEQRSQPNGANATGEHD